MQQLICGDYSMNDQNPDPDSGKVAVVGFGTSPRTRREALEPSIRSDLTAPKVVSVADNQNYGNELGAFSLIYPRTPSTGA